MVTSAAGGRQAGNAPATHEDLGLMQGFPPAPEKTVTRHNGLWQPPFNRWAYQNMRRLWPTAPIAPAPSSQNLPTAFLPSIATLSVTREDGPPARFDQILNQTFTDSLIVMSEGQIVFETYRNGMTPTQPHIMFSCTKSFIGLFALQAIEGGLVSYDTALTEILPELPAASGFATASFGQLMDMTVAVEFDETYANPNADIHDYMAVLDAGTKAGAAGAMPDLYTYAKSLPRDPKRAHGEVFHYQTPQSDVLNWAVNRLYGQSFAELFADRIMAPAGMSDEAYVLLDKSGLLFAGGGLCASPGDMAKCAAMMLASKDAGTQAGLSPSILDTLYKGGSRTAFAKGPHAEQGMAREPWSYCAQWWVRHTPSKEAIVAIGVNGQWFYLDHAHDVAIVKQSSLPESSNWRVFDNTISAFDAVIDHILQLR